MIERIHPVVLIAAVSSLISLVSIFLASRFSQKFVRISAGIGALGGALTTIFCLLVLFPEWTDARYRSYKAFYRDVHTGMTRNEVLARLDWRYPNSGIRKRPNIAMDEPTKLWFFMNPEDSNEPNCEGIFLTLQNGRVTKKAYSAD